MKKNLLFTFLLVSIAGIFSSDTFAQRPMVGGYKMVAKTDAGAVAAAEFAVNAQGEKMETSFELAEILKAERQVVQGSNYRLCMQVNPEGDPPFVVQAVVYVDLKNNYKLSSWAASECGEVSDAAAGSKASAFKAVENPSQDAGLGLAADFAIKERSTKTKTKMILAEIMKAEDQEAKLGARNLRLCLKSNTKGKFALAQAVVSVDQYSNFKLVSWADTNCEGTGSTPVAGGFKPDAAFKPVDNAGEDVGVQLATDFAIQEQSTKTKTKITLAQIVKIEDQEPKLGARNFRLCLKVNATGKSSLAQAMVTVDQYSNYKLVSWTPSNCGK